MTLHEHATKILKESNKKYIFSPVQQAVDTLFNAAYDELRAQVDELQTKIDLATARAELAEKSEPPEEPTYKHICLSCMGTGMFLGSRCACGTIPKPETPAPKPPKKAVYEWGDAISENPPEICCSRNGCTIGRIRDHGSSLRHRFQWSATDGFWGKTTTLPLAKAAVEAVVRAHYGDAL